MRAPRLTSVPDTQEFAREGYSLLAQHLQDQAHRRKTMRWDTLTIYVDDAPRGVIDLARINRHAIHLDQEAALIEVRATCGRGELLLACHVLTDNDTSAQRTASIALEGRRVISFTVQSRDQAAPVLTVAYEEDTWIRALPPRCRQWKYALTTRYRRIATAAFDKLLPRSIFVTGNTLRQNGRLIRTVVASCFLAIGAIDASWFWTSQQVVEQQPRSTDTQAISAPTGGINVARVPVGMDLYLPKRAATPLEPVSGSIFIDAALRQWLQQPAATDLLRVPTDHPSGGKK